MPATDSTQGQTITEMLGATGSTHGYGPIGAALGAFVGFADQRTARGIWSALIDAASQEWSWWDAARKNGPSDESAYHYARWCEMRAAADYMEGIARPFEL